MRTNIFNKTHDNKFDFYAGNTATKKIHFRRINTMTEAKQNLKTGMTFFQPTRAAFLNALLGTRYKQWMKCSYQIDERTILWFPSLGGDEKSGWKNTVVNNGDKIIEEYVGSLSAKPSNFDVRATASKRIAFDKYCICIDSFGDRVIGGYGKTRVYEFLGVYLYSEAESTLYRRVYNKIADETNLVKV